MKYKIYIKRFFIGLLTCILLIATSVFILVTFYKKELTTALIDNLKEDHGLILKVEDVSVSFFSNWPNASIQLRKTVLAGELYLSKPILTAGSISFSLDLMRLLKKQFIIESISIKDAKIDLEKFEDDTKNFELKKKITNGSAQPIKFEIKKISIKNTQFNFSDKGRGSNIDVLFMENTIKLIHAQDGFEAEFFGDVNIGGLLFKKQKGAFLQHTRATLNLHASVFTKSKTIFIHPPSSVIIGNHPYILNSFIELNDKRQLMLSIKSDNIDYEQGKSILNTNLQKMLSNFKVTKSIDAKIIIITKLGVKQDPIIIANINGKNNNITIGHSKIPYSNVSFKGLIVSLDSSRTQGNTEKAKIIFTDVKGNLYDFPFTASITVSNFDHPYININSKLFITASKINFKPGEDLILKGNCVASVKYEGPTNKLNKKEFLDAPMILNAGLFFNALSYQEKGKPYVYTVNGNANIFNKDLQCENLYLTTDAGNVILQGNIKDFTNYALGFSNGFKTTLTARSESFNLNPYLTTKKSEKSKEATTKAVKKTIKEEQSNFDFNVSLFAKKLFIRNVKATNASINLSYKNQLLDVKSLNMNACDGKLAAKGTVYDLNKITAEVKIEGMDVNKLFKEFENFGQKAITSEQLQGNIFIDANFNTELDNNMEVIGSSMDGKIKVKLTDGHLLNFEPIQNISDYVFRNRDFKDVSFSEINETCTIKGFEMLIHEMEIGSNVLNLFVSGNYNFKDNSNINILVPWSNLKKRGKNFIPKNSGQTAENSKGLKLNYSGPPKKLKLSLGYK
ncbi:MAG: AsmA family protein [Bacteroidetes bacterium]|nr:AsmA family protein [Bacteroidota bacterium]